MGLYVLGILWSIGSPIEDVYPYLMLRHRDRYFLDVVREALYVSTNVFEGESLTGPQYKLKIFHFDLSQLGHGLRLSDGKEALTVLDFVGQAHKKYSFEDRFKALLSRTRKTVEHEIKHGFANVLEAARSN